MEIAIATRTDPHAWFDADPALLVTAVEVLNEQAQQ